jgi:hypothetical protein
VKSNILAGKKVRFLEELQPAFSSRELMRSNINTGGGRGGVIYQIISCFENVKSTK